VAVSACRKLTQLREQKRKAAEDCLVQGVKPLIRMPTSDFILFVVNGNGSMIQKI
jgi:hypothetical protein